MNISNMIKNVKVGIDKQKQRAVNKKAQKLKAMREERIKLEGRANILKTYNKEQERIKQARAEVKANSGLAQFKKGLDERKKAKKTKNDAFEFGGRNVFE